MLLHNINQQNQQKIRRQLKEDGFEGLSNELTAATFSGFLNKILSKISSIHNVKNFPQIAPISKKIEELPSTTPFEAEEKMLKLNQENRLCDLLKKGLFFERKKQCDLGFSKKKNHFFFLLIKKKKLTFF